MAPRWDLKLFFGYNSSDARILSAHSEARPSGVSSQIRRELPGETGKRAQFHRRVIGQCQSLMHLHARLRAVVEPLDHGVARGRPSIPRPVATDRIIKNHEAPRQIVLV